MSLVWAVVITLGAVAVAVAAILLVRRRAPEGSFFADGDRAAGFFGVLAAGFAILLGFVVFLAFDAFDQSRSGGETEALLVAQQFETAQFMPAAVGRRLSGELVCYARSIVHQEWPRMEAGEQGNVINPWAAAQFRTLREVDPSTPTQESAFDKWLEQTSGREQARNDRIHGASGVIPNPLWFVLVFSSLAIFVYMLFFADRGERAKTQALLMGSVTAVIATMLLLLSFLDNPFHDGVGGLRPVAMERTLGTVDEALTAIGVEVPIPCDAQGRPS